MVVYLEGQYLQKVDWQSMAEASKGNGVTSGLGVTVVSGLTVRVGTGGANINGNPITKTSTTDVALDVADTKPRKDLVVINDAGTISKVTGTAGDIYPDPDKSRTLTPIPRPPELPANSILLAEVWVGANATSLVADDIADKRQFVVIQPSTSELVMNLTAGEAISAGQVVYASANNTVKKADNTNRSKVVGVAYENIALNASGKVLIYGPITVTADGAIAVGDPVAAAATAGRVVSLTAHTPTFTGSALGTHSHSFTPSGSVSSSFSGSAGTTSEVSAGTPSGTIGAPTLTVTGVVFSPTVSNLYAASTSGGSPTSLFKAFTDYYTTSVATSAHIHTFAGSALGTHSHSFTPAGSVSSSFSGSAGTTGAVSAGTPSGTVSSIGTAEILGKALTSTAAAGETLQVLVCLAG